MPDPDDPVGDADATPSMPAEPARGGRPSQLTRECVAAAIDEALAETGREPSVRELQARLGGGRTRLTALRDAVRTERLIAAAVPADGTTADALATAHDAVLQVLATEALRAADQAIDTSRTEADTRVQAAERLAERAGDAENAAALERERLLGRLEMLETRLVEGRETAEALAGELAAARERAAAHHETETALRTALAEARAAHEHAAAVATDLEARLDAAEERLATSEAALAHERAARAADVERLTERHAAETARAAALDAALARSGAERDAATARADAAQARLEPLQHERDAAAARAERLAGELDAVRREARLADERRDARALDDMAALHAEIGALRERLSATTDERGDRRPSADAPSPDRSDR